MIKIKKVLTNLIYLSAFASALTLSGCSKQVAEEEQIIIADTAEETGLYTMATCEKGDVILSKNISATYVQAAEQNVMMDSGGRLISRVCVHEGDHVEAGDILLLLDDDNLEERIENLKYSIEQQELQLSYLDTNEEFAREETYYNFVFGGGLDTEDDLKEYEKADNKVKQTYKYRREDIEDALEYDRMEYEELKRRLEQSKVKATMSGMVYKIEANLEGSTTKKDQVIMTIMSEAEGYFSTDEPDVFDQTQIEEVYDMRITYGDAKGDYELTPVRLSEWGEEQFYSILSSPEGAMLTVGDSGNMTVNIASKENVLTLPNTCIHQAGNDYYVYVLNEEGMKTVCFIEIGLVGNDVTEILSGIAENDQVVKK